MFGSVVRRAVTVGVRVSFSSTVSRVVSRTVLFGRVREDVSFGMRRWMRGGKCTFAFAHGRQGFEDGMERGILKAQSACEDKKKTSD